MKKMIFQPADHRQESFIPLSRGKSFIVFLPCRKSMAFDCQALIAGRQTENQSCRGEASMRRRVVTIREHSWTTICFLSFLNLKQMR
jgi:hypothetical protein